MIAEPSPENFEILRIGFAEGAASVRNDDTEQLEAALSARLDAQKRVVNRAEGRPGNQQDGERKLCRQICHVEGWCEGDQEPTRTLD
jgi:hypothetical protein